MLSSLQRKSRAIDYNVEARCVLEQAINDPAEDGAVGVCRLFATVPRWRVSKEGLDDVRRDVDRDDLVFELLV